MLESGAVRGGFPEIPAKLDNLDTRVIAVERRQRLNRSIGAAIIDEHHFECLGPRPHRLDDLLVQRREAFPLVVHRQDKGKSGRAHQMSL